MSITFVQGNTKNYGGSLSLAFTSSNTGGNALFVGANLGDASTATISDTLGNTYTLIQTTLNPGSNIYTVLWFCPSCLTGSNVVTIGGTGAAAGTCAFGIAEFSGINTLDKTGESTSSGAGATWTSNSLTTTVANELLIGCISNGYGALTVNSPFMTISNVNYFVMYYDIIGTTQTISGSGSKRNSTSDAWATILSGFYSAGGGGTGSFSENEIPTGTINGTNATFTTTNTPNPASSFKLYQDGLRMASPGDYTLTGNAFTYTTAPVTNTIHLCDYRY